MHEAVRDPHRLAAALPSFFSSRFSAPSTSTSVRLRPAIQLTPLSAAHLLIAAACLLGTGPSQAETPRPAPISVGRFPQEVARHFALNAAIPARDVLRVALSPDGSPLLETAAGKLRWRDEQWVSTSEPLPGPSGDKPPTDAEIHQLAAGPDGRLAAAAADGLWERGGDEAVWQRLEVSDGQGRLWAAADVRGTTYDRDGQLWFATRAGVGQRTADGWRFFDGRDGLPYNDFTCCAAGGDGSVWFGTRRGAIRRQNDRWHYRQGKRWLPDDHVRDIAVADDGTAWFATPQGVGCIGRQPMTLAEKAAFYEQEIDALIKRTPFGYVAEADLPRAGDKSQVTLHDSDNDGLWTAMYGASQCFAYAATGSAESKARAAQAFEALRFLQEVTQGGPNSPPLGYVARTILPADGPDPNEGRLAQDLLTQANHDRLWKVYSPRWPRSADGNWYWKSDTSSDELDGHYFFYPLYYDLVADTPEERRRVRQVVRDLTDHLIKHDFVLQEHDGRPTRWGMFRPSVINHDYDWVAERGLNSLSMLSYLTVAHHVTGESRFAETAQKLVKEHSYHMNAMVPKLQRGMGSGNQSDDEMAFMSFYNILKYSPPSDRRQQLLAAFYWYWTLEQPERNPFFDFCYAAFGQGQSIKDPWDDNDLSPWENWLADAVETLVDFPLDRIDWGHQNSHRLDIVSLPRQNGHGLLESNRGDRGYRVDGKVLPVSERFFHHWNTDPWRLDYGGTGRSLGSGTVYLLPYYMGRYHGFIQE
jgi:hypothetical protein